MKDIVKAPDSQQVMAAIFSLEGKMRAHPLVNSIEPVITHHFAPGVYVREMVAPAGILMTGMIHKTEHVSVMLSGRMLVTDGQGNGMEITGPRIEIAKPGIKRVGYVIEEVRWITIHATDETDPDVLEELLVTNDPAEIEYLMDRHDYEQVVQEFGITDDVIGLFKRLPVQWTNTKNVSIEPSKRHGQGVFARAKFPTGAIIAPAIRNGVRSHYCRYANHSAEPNAKMVRNGLDADLVALRDVDNEEITVDYRDNLRP